MCGFPEQLTDQAHRRVVVWVVVAVIWLICLGLLISIAFRQRVIFLGFITI
jgi:hypothetical protein